MKMISIFKYCKERCAAPTNMTEEKQAPRRGDYKTKGALAVRQLMEKTHQAHVTAEEVHRRLEREGVRMGLTTVYRQLERLVEEGAVRKIYGDRSGFCYQLAGDACREHYHMVCTACGKLAHLDCDVAEGLFRHITEHHGFAVDLGRTVLYGSCADCRRAMKKE